MNTQLTRNYCKILNMELFYKIKLFLFFSTLLWKPLTSAITTMTFTPLSMSTSEWDMIQKVDKTLASPIECAAVCLKRNGASQDCNGILFNTDSNTCSLVNILFNYDTSGLFDGDWTYFVRGTYYIAPQFNCLSIFVSCAHLRVFWPWQKE